MMLRSLALTTVQDMSSSDKGRYVCILGDAGSPAVHSGTQYFFYKSLRALEPRWQTLNLNYARYAVQLRKYLWGLGQVICGRKFRGYQFTNAFLESIWAPTLRSHQPRKIINFFQLYPMSILDNPGIRKLYYIDMTLRQLFDLYGIGQSMSAAGLRDALDREQLGYDRAEMIVVKSGFTAESLRRDYHIPDDRIRICTPGASLDAELLRETDGDPKPHDDAPFTIGFVGKEWERKGLDRLIRAVRLANGHGAKIVLNVLGCTRDQVPGELLGDPFVNWLGFVDKQKAQAKFISHLRACDLGVLLSRAEAAGIALCEFQSLGIPTLCTDVGGSRELAHPTASITLTEDASDDVIADVLFDLSRRNSHYNDMLKAARAHKSESRWDSAARKFLQILHRESTVAA